MIIEEFCTPSGHCFIDDQNRYQGEHKRFHSNGKLRSHCFYLDDAVHSESKYYFPNGDLRHHNIYIYGKLQNTDPATLTAEDKVFMSLQHGIKFLP